MFFALYIIGSVYSQKYDKNWLGGHGTVFVDTALSVLMQFEEEGIHFQKTKTKLDIETGVIAVSDKTGIHQFSTNGNAVVTWDGEVMVGGKGFNQGATNDDFGTVFGDTVINSYYNPYTYQVIPDLYEDSVYYLIHAFVWEDADQPEEFFNEKTQISKIDMRLRNGRGEVVYKNQPIDEEEMGVPFTIIKHGNGKDWWVVLRSLHGLEYKAILLRKDSVITKVWSKIEELDSEWFSNDDKFRSATVILQSSLDGRYLLDSYGMEHVKLLEFDRCNGSVSFLDTVKVGLIVDDPNHPNPYFFSYMGYKFSPSGRYLYGYSYSNFSQWDLWADDISASRVDMGHPWAVTLHADGQWHKGYGGFTVFGYGPDGKLYNLWRGVHSVIENPDEKCPACGFCAGWEQGPPPSCLGVEYKLFSGFYPNYRLGPLEGSPCDTIPDEPVPPEHPTGDYGLSVWPSPSSGPATVEITLPDYSQGRARIAIVDMLGRYLYSHTFPPYAYLHQLDLSDWAAGVYNILLLEGNDLKATARLVVIR